MACELALGVLDRRYRVARSSRVSVSQGHDFKAIQRAKLRVICKRYPSLHSLTQAVFNVEVQLATRMAYSAGMLEVEGFRWAWKGDIET